MTFPEEINNGRFKNVYAVGDYNHAKKILNFILNIRIAYPLPV